MSIHLLTTAIKKTQHENNKHNNKLITFRVIQQQQTYHFQGDTFLFGCVEWLELNFIVKKMYNNKNVGPCLPCGQSESKREIPCQAEALMMSLCSRHGTGENWPNRR